MKPIFLLSLPRSGSTLLQRKLACHRAISTTNEPWVLLPLLSAFSQSKVNAQYDQTILTSALQDFRDCLTNGQSDWDSSVRIFAESLYSKVESGADYFLDKTPRYALFAEELRRTFPDAKFIILWRDPLAIVQSMNDTWESGAWGIHRYAIDLYEGLERLVEFARIHKDDSTILRYEEFLSNPDDIVTKLWTDLDLSTSDLRSTEEAVNLQGEMGDPKRHQTGNTVRPQSQSWRKRPVTLLRKRWMRRYIQWIGADRMETMGYEIESFLTDIDDLPIKWDGFADDFIKMTGAALYRFANTPVLKIKWQNLVKGRPNYVHK